MSRRYRCSACGITVERRSAHDVARCCPRLRISEAWRVRRLQARARALAAVLDASRLLVAIAAVTWLGCSAEVDDVGARDEVLVDGVLDEAPSAPANPAARP